MFRLRCLFLQKIKTTMNGKELYEAPVTLVLEVKFEGLICQSGGDQYTIPGYGDSLEI